MFFIKYNETRADESYFGASWPSNTAGGFGLGSGIIPGANLPGKRCEGRDQDGFRQVNDLPFFQMKILLITIIAIQNCCIFKPNLT